MHPHKHQIKLETSLFTSTGYVDGYKAMDAALMYYRKNLLALK